MNKPLENLVAFVFYDIVLMTDNSHQPGLFHDVTFCLLPLGSLTGRVRRDIIKHRLIENGAKSFDTCTPEVNFIITSKDGDFQMINEFVSDAFQGFIVDVAWVTDSLKNQHRADPSSYIIDTSHMNRREREVSEDTISGPETPSKRSRGPLSSVVKSSTNSRIASIFDELESVASSSPERRNTFRAMAYRKAAAVLREHGREVRTEVDADELRSKLGEKTVEKIKEYIRTGKIQKAELVKREDTSAGPRQELSGIWGIGPSVASELTRKGFDSVEKLRTPDGEQLLNDNQRTGLKYYEELRPKMPRSEVEEIKQFVYNVKQELFGDDLEMHVCGSYRRGAEYSSDADILLSWKIGTHALSPEVTISKLVTALQRRQFILDRFNKKNHHTIFLGICRLGPGRSARRFDMKVWPRESLACAMLHFTGNADFNRKLRLYAKRHGFKLSDIGLNKGDGTVIGCVDEEAIFEALGLQFIPPNQRTSAAELVPTTGCPPDSLV
jgi:DNA polymerase/3'-5' exonuclease PolX